MWFPLRTLALVALSTLLVAGEAEPSLDGYAIAQITKRAVKDRAPADQKAAMAVAWILAPLDYRKHRSLAPEGSDDPNVYLQWKEADFYATLTVYSLMKFFLEHRYETSVAGVLKKKILAKEDAIPGAEPSKEWKAALHEAYNRAVDAQISKFKVELRDLAGGISILLMTLEYNPSYCANPYLLPGRAKTFKAGNHYLLEGDATLDVDKHGFFRLADLAPAFNKMTLRQPRAEGIATEQGRKVNYDTDENKLYILLAGTNPAKYLSNERTAIEDFSGLVTVDYWKGQVPVDVRVTLDNSTARIEPLAKGSHSSLLYLYPVYDRRVESARIPDNLEK